MEAVPKSLTSFEKDLFVKQVSFFEMPSIENEWLKLIPNQCRFDNGSVRRSPSSGAERA